MRTIDKSVITQWSIAITCIQGLFSSSSLADEIFHSYKKGLSIFSTHNYFFYVRFLIRYLCALCDPLFLPQLKIRICLKHIVEYYFAQNWGWILESCSKVVLFCLNTVFQSAFFQGFKYYSVRQTIFYKCVLLELFLVSKYKGQT